MRERVLITGGAGYIGAHASRELAAAGKRVRVLDQLLHGQRAVAAALEREGIEVVEGDVRDGAVRAAALAGVGAVVHLAAIVGDPACARDPELSDDVNVGGSTALVADAEAAGVARFVFASTCSNYGRMLDPTTPIREDGELRPVSLYASQKVQIEQLLLGFESDTLHPTCLRLATVYGAAPRMRFDLTVNEFTRDLWAGRDLEVFGEQFWRPYVHARDVAVAIHTVLDAPLERVHREVFNVGRSSENYRKLDLVDKIREHVSAGEVRYVARSEDPRDYKVSFEKIRDDLGFETSMTVSDGIAELVRDLESGAFGDPYDPGFRN
ncbi:MAG TPA: NAD(P)-dependent oxidoreductase [Gaiellales bacterium]|nr:NAD(P)-dependent oxidoreductase [Gaiellales bacterium]